MFCLIPSKIMSMIMISHQRETQGENTKKEKQKNLEAKKLARS